MRLCEARTGPNAKVVVRTELLTIAVRELVFAYPDEIHLRKAEKSFRTTVLGR